jgi:hypothetical protein
MRHPLFVRARTADDHDQLHAGMRLPVVFVLRRCRILLASARGEIDWVSAGNLGCDDQTVHTAIAAFNARGLASLTLSSSRPTPLIWPSTLRGSSSYAPSSTGARAPSAIRQTCEHWNWPQRSASRRP